MSFVEFIGFLISFLAFVFLLLRPIFEIWRRPKMGEEGESVRSAKDQHLRDFLKALDIDMEESGGVHSLQKPKLKEKKFLSPRLPVERAKVKALPLDFGREAEERAEKVETKNRQLDLEIKSRFSGSSVVSSRYRDVVGPNPYDKIHFETPSRAKILLNRLSSKQEMVLLHEIFSRPKSFRL